MSERSASRSKAAVQSPPQPSRSLTSDRQAARDPAPLLSSLPERLRGIYRLGVNDGAGPLNGSDTFTREFQTPPIQRQAADRIEQLEAELRRLVDVADNLIGELEDPGTEALAAVFCARQALGR